jgi:hypothetical protein
MAILFFSYLRSILILDMQPGIANFSVKLGSMAILFQNTYRIYVISNEMQLERQPTECSPAVPPGVARGPWLHYRIHPDIVHAHQALPEDAFSHHTSHVMII